MNILYEQSEDDAQRGRREKRGVMQKIKEKLHRSYGTDQQQHTTTTATKTGTGVGGTGVYNETHEKKGVMEKIKEKLHVYH